MRTFRSRRHPAVAGATFCAIVAALALSGCGGGDPAPPPPPTTFSASFQPQALSGSVTVGGNPQPWTTTVTLDRVPDGAVNFGVVDTAGVLAPASVSVVPQGGASYQVSLVTSGSLGAGNYSGNLQLRACRDSAATCAQPLPGSPWPLPYTLSALPSLASVANQCNSLDARKSWVRSYVNDAYLWYREVPAANPAAFSTPEAYFSALKVTTPTASGKPRDLFSVAIDNASFEAITTGEDLGYGMSISRGDGGAVRVLYVEPGSPASAVGVTRGDTIVSVDGLPVATGPEAVILAALFPSAAGRTHSFTLRSVAGAQRTVSLQSLKVTSTPVLSTQVLNVGGARIGYILFTGFVVSAQDQLIAAIQNLSNARIDDLVLDLRYNGGGLLTIGAQLGYMIGGAKTQGKVFERLVFNEKRTQDASDSVLEFETFRYDPVTFDKTTTRLPSLGLGRVFVLTTGSTCSASESVINGLRGVDVEVIVLGSTTCGKPYAFSGKQNCGMTYLPVEAAGVNAKGFGDYADGFAPACAVADDLARPLGDPSEGMLAAALSRRATGQCPPTAQDLPARIAGMAVAPEGRVLRNPLRENKYLKR